MYNTRIAPSPTGDMHLGTARTAYFNWLAARASGGRFILRIDDTDTQRNNSSKTQDIFQIMGWLGLNYDDIIFQSERLSWYQACAHSLIKSDFAVMDNGAVRLALRPDFLANLPLTWRDDLAGDIPIADEDMDYIKSMVILKSDGYPTYNFASALDDLDLNINFVIRGTDHIKNTPKQIALYYLFGSTAMIPKYAHVGLLTQNKKKLSKRDGAASMLSYRDAGYDSEAMLNFMLRLGWGPKVDDKTTAVLPRDKALEMFLDQGKMKSSPANIDLAKLDSFDRKYKAKLPAV